MPATDRTPGRRNRYRPELSGLEDRRLLSASDGLVPVSDGSLPALPSTPNPPTLTSVVAPAAGVNGSAVDPSAPAAPAGSAGMVSANAESSDLVVRVGETVTNQVVGTPSRAGQSLTYTLEPSDPALTTLDMHTGAFSWTPTADLASADGSPKAYRIKVRVTENSPDAPFEVASFIVRVLPADASAKAVADATAEANGGTAVDASTGALVAEAQARPRAVARKAAAAEKQARAVLQLARRVPNPQVQARLLRRAARLSARAVALA
ncbi:MAG: hypothetical protein U0800_20225 [Isosphaeraceae bacterium]